jgi:fatty-acyl-CoA synthase
MTRTEFETVDEMIRALEHSDRDAILFEDESYTWREAVRAAATRAAYAIDTKQAGPFHIGFLFENIPELCLWLAAGSVTINWQSV